MRSAAVAWPKAVPAWTANPIAMEAVSDFIRTTPVVHTVVMMNVSQHLHGAAHA
jgi:hypothetical protein